MMAKKLLACMKDDSAEAIPNEFEGIINKTVQRNPQTRPSITEVIAVLNVF